jgi:hypothetical protein
LREDRCALHIEQDIVILYIFSDAGLGVGHGNIPFNGRLDLSMGAFRVKIGGQIVRGRSAA